MSTGFGVLLFEKAIFFLEETRAEIPLTPVAPILGALALMALFAAFGPGGMSGADIASLKKYAVPGGPKPPDNWFLRACGNALAAVITLGSGNSLGPEAPAAVLGANMAYGASQVLSLFGSGEEESQAKDEGGRKMTRKEKELIEEALAGSKIVAELTSKEVDLLAESFKEVKIAAGEPLMKQGDSVGDSDPGMFITETGELDVLVAQEGDEGLGKKVFTYEGGGKLIGELAVLFDAPRAASVIATKDCVLWSVDRASFRKVGGRSTGSARRLSMTPDSVLASGAAAGVAAGFNAPIAGIFFASEVVRPSGENNLDLTTRLLAAALSAAVVRTFTAGRPGLGDVTSLQFAWLGGNTELLAFIILGAVVGCVAYSFQRLQKVARQVMASIKEAGLPDSVKPLVGSSITCAIAALCSGRVLFDGFRCLNEVLGDASHPMNPAVSQWSIDSLTMPRGFESEMGVFTASTLLLLVAFKMVSTIACQVSGLVGGVFAPSLFMGACLGGAFGRALEASFGGLATVSTASTYLVVGAASMLAANCSVPITSVVLAVELAGGASYEATLPLICGIAVASYFTGALLPFLFEGLNREEALRRYEDDMPPEDLGV